MYCFSQKGSFHTLSLRRGTYFCITPIEEEHQEYGEKHCIVPDIEVSRRFLSLSKVFPLIGLRVRPAFEAPQFLSTNINILDVNSTFTPNKSSFSIFARLEVRKNEGLLFSYILSWSCPLGC